MRRRPIVIVATRSQKFERGLEAAEEFGDLRYLQEDEDSKINPFRSMDASIAIRARLDELGFDPQRDFVAVVGGNILVALTLLVAYDEARKLKLLIFDAANERYVERVVDAGRAMTPAEHVDRGT